MRLFINPVTFILLIIFIIWISFLLSVRQNYKSLSQNDTYLLKDFILRNYSFHNQWDFLKTLWKDRPSLLSLKVEDEASSLVYSSHRIENKWEKLSFLQYTINLPLVLKNGSTLKVFFVYAILPLSELYYYSFISLCLSVLFFLLYFFSIFWKSF